MDSEKAEQADENEDNDEEGLEFIDPIALSKAKQVEAAANKEQV